MILRDAVLSDERQPLEPFHSNAALQDTVERTDVAAVVPAITLDCVSRWLQTCDAAAKADLAACLAPDLENLRVEAKKQGFEAGRAQGLTQARASMEESVALLQSALHAAEKALAREAAQLSELCADVIVEALTKIAGPVLSSRDAVVGTVRQILARVRDDCELLIKVSHADLPVLRDLETTLQRAMGGRKVSLSADDGVSLGGCIVASRMGTFDGRLETQLAGLLESIRDARKSQEDGS